MKVYRPQNVEEIEKKFLVQINLYYYNCEFYNAVIGLYVTSINKRSNMLRIIVCLLLVSWLRLRPRRGWENNVRTDLKKEILTIRSR
jgi:hypothetical protein